jgi:hypothetical protein
MPTAALSRQSEIIQCPTLRSDLGLGREVHQLGGGGTAILVTVLLDEAVELLPLAGEREVARVAAHNNREIHLLSFLFVRDSSFFAD